MISNTIRTDRLAGTRVVLLGRSHAIRRVRALIERVAPTDTFILIHGETGTGKELVARLIHAQSTRANNPFIAINCASFPPGLIESQLFGHERGSFTGATTRRHGVFETASTGTLFLDETADLNPHAQACLLRVLDDQFITRIGSNHTIKVDVRVIGATHQDLASLVRRGGFREDLYYRLRVVTLRVPALRERPEDIPILAAVFMDRYATRYGKNLGGIAPDAMRVLAEYSWPGNVRELRTTIEASVAVSQHDTLIADDLPEHIRHPALIVDSGEEVLRFREAERDAVQRALAKTHGKKGEAARLLGCSRKYLWSLLKKYEHTDPAA